MSKLICQSCGMPLMEEEQYGTNADQSKNKEYCSYCFKDGAFLTEETMEEMIETCIPFVIEAGEYSDAESARVGLNQYFPTLNRWKSN